MQEIIHELFTEEELNIFDEERLNLSLKKVISDLDNKKINFYYLGNDQLYREILPRYFKWQGYGYLGNSSLHILQDYMMKDRDLADTSLALLLLDTGIIKEIPVTEKNPLEIENTIKYKRSKGFKEKITISYDVLDRFPFYIKEVQCGHKNIINIEVNNEGSRKSVTLDVDIPANDHITYNFTESLIIYTDFGVEIIDFSVVCDTTPAANNKVLEDFDSFLKLVKINRKSAKNIFSNEDSFKAFLEQNGNIEQILIYEDCKKISDEFNTYPFSIFCDINELKKDSLFKDAFSKKSKPNIEKANRVNEKPIDKNITKKDALEKKLEESTTKPNSENVQNTSKRIEENYISAKTTYKPIYNKQVPDASIINRQTLDKEIIKKQEIINRNEEKIVTEKDDTLNKSSQEVESKKEYKKIDKIEYREPKIETREKETKKSDNKTISLEYTGKVTNHNKDNIKYNKDLITKSKNKIEEKSKVLDYGEIKNKKEDKISNEAEEEKNSILSYKNETIEKNKITDKNENKEIKDKEVQHKIKKIEYKEAGVGEPVIKELQRDSKYKITKKENKHNNKEAHKKDMNIIEIIKEMLKGFKKD